MKKILLSVAVTLLLLPYAAQAEQLKGLVVGVDTELEDGTTVHETMVVNGPKLISIETTALKTRQLQNLEGTYVVLQGDWKDGYTFDLDESQSVVLKGKFRRSADYGPVDYIKKEDTTRLNANFRNGLDPKAYHRPLWVVGKFLGNTNTVIVSDWSNAIEGNNVTRSAASNGAVNASRANTQTGAAGAGMSRE